jgi:inorganic triphosphatase YgiF
VRQIGCCELERRNKACNISTEIPLRAIMPPPREIELKFEVPSESLPDLNRGPLLKRARSSRQKSASLVSIYFDTKKLRLRRNALSLRIRRNGRRVVQTVKQETGPATFVRNEWEHEIGSPQPDLNVVGDTPLAQLSRKKLRHSLMPVFETRVRRKTFQLNCGESEIELSVDKGEIAAGRKALPICEVELELKRGQRGDLFKLAKTLADDVPAQLAIVSKAERGYGLFTGEKPQPIKALQIALEPEANVQSAFQMIAWACIQQLIANQPIMRRGDPDALHQMRVALRRLRAAISLFSDMLADTQTDTVKSELKWIAGELGPARELDVFSKRVAKPILAGKPNGAGVVILSRDLRQRREDAIVRALAAVESARFRKLVLDTAAWIEAGDWINNPDISACTLREQSIADAAAKELRRRWKKLLKRGKRLGELDAQRRHRLRIQGKKLRYAAEFFASAFPHRRQQKFVTSLERLQDALGDLNDIVVHEKLSERFIEGNDGGAKGRIGRTRKAFAAGRLSGREEARIESVLKEAKRAYKSFAKKKPFWA